MKEKYLPSKKYYSISTEGYYGVVVDEKTRNKIQEVLRKAESDIKNILYHSEDVRPYSWDLVNVMQDNEIEKQEVFHYSAYRPDCSVKDCIENVKLADLRYMKDFYEISSEDELYDLKDCLRKELTE